MKHTTLMLSGLAVILALVLCGVAQAEQHRATRLGNPATRFAPPLRTPEDLRALFRDPTLKADIADIAHQWGWPGNLDDLHRAAMTNEITEVQIPVGDTMPFMSSRENGKPICLRNVLWAGREPVSAYAFTFASNGRRYRCVTPKPCSNYFLEELEPLPKAALAIECAAPAKVLAGRPAEVCLTVRNAGNVAEPEVLVTLPIPAGAEVVSAAAGGVSAESRITWTLASLAPNTARQVCARFKLSQPGTMTFNPTTSSTSAAPVQSACATTVAGVSAILLEVVDLADPIEVGKEVTYDIKVTNQGTAIGTNVRLICTLPTSQEFASSTGDTTVSAQAGTVSMAPLANLAPKAVASWRVIVKAREAGDARFKAELRSDQFQEPITEDESTQQY